MKRFVKNTIRYAIKTLFAALLGASVMLFAISPALIVIATKNEHWAWMFIVTLPITFGTCIATIERIIEGKE